VDLGLSISAPGKRPHEGVVGLPERAPLMARTGVEVARSRPVFKPPSNKTPSKNISFIAGTIAARPWKAWPGLCSRTLRSRRGCGTTSSTPYRPLACTIFQQADVGGLQTPGSQASFQSARFGKSWFKGASSLLWAWRKIFTASSIALSCEAVDP
jgi:hypothetical protein